MSITIDQEYPFGYVFSLELFIERMRHFPSPDPKILPQRSNFAFVDSYRPIRDINRNLYKGLYKEFLQCHMKEGLLYPGIYFLFDYFDRETKFYYIGISGTKRNPHRPLWKRIEEHLKNKDMIFYSIAFKKMRDAYKKDTKIFYEDDNYEKKKDEYKRQFNALETVTIRYIAWINHSQFNYQTWDAVESFFISTYRPRANGSKLDEPLEFPPLSDYKSKFEEVKNYLFDALITQLGDKVYE
jgi:hypothetical protein